MSSATSDSLSKAYRLIEADELAAARAILEPVLAEDPENADAWWLYAHAVSDTSEARRALDNVLRLNPDYPGVGELSDQLESMSGSEAETEPLPVTELEPEPEFMPVSVVEPEAEASIPMAAPATEGLPNLDDDLEDTSRPASASRMLWLVAAVVLVLAIVAFLALQNRGDETPVVLLATPSPEVAAVLVTAEATPEALIPVEPTEDAGMLETEVPASAEATTESDIGIVLPASTEEPAVNATPVAMMTSAAQAAEATEAVEIAITETTPLGQEVALVPAEGDFTPLEDALSDRFTLPEDSIFRAETDLGDTLLISVCSSAGTEVRAALPQVMDVVASHAAIAAGDADAVGTRLVNCTSNRPLLIIAVEKEKAVEYAVGNLSAAEFQSLWKPQ